MSLLGSNDAVTEERRLHDQASKRSNMSEEMQQAGTDNKFTRSTEVKTDPRERSNQDDSLGTSVMQLALEKQPDKVHAGELAKIISKSMKDTPPDEGDTSRLHDVRHHIRLDNAANLPMTSVPLEPESSEITEMSCIHMAHDDQQETLPFLGPPSLQSSTRTATESIVGEHSNPALRGQNLENLAAEVGNPSKSRDEDSRLEIQSIMEQFHEQTYTSENDNCRSSENRGTGHALSMSLPHPPRSNRPDGEAIQSPSLESTMSNTHKSTVFSHLPMMEEARERGDQKDFTGVPTDHSAWASSNRLGQSLDSPLSPRSSIPPHKALPPAPDPEPDLPFDFHRFLDQLRHRTADPVAKFLRSFLVEFGKKQWMVHEQVKIISDFQLFITNKMAQCEVWRDMSDTEFDNAKEGMEKLVMNRLYTQTFSPAIPPLPTINVKGKPKTHEKSIDLGRRGQHQEDIERDDVLAQKVQIYGWVKEEHLDIPPIGERGRRFLNLARQGNIGDLENSAVADVGNIELVKIKSYRAPRDKVICILNCCKVIFGTSRLIFVDPIILSNFPGLLRDSKSKDTSADSFVPLLILVVLQANPDHLVSNVQYIMRFRNQDKLAGEAGYYLSSLVRNCW